MTNKSANTRTSRDAFVEKFGITSLRALASIRKSQAGHKVNVPVSTVTATYKANLTRGAYKPFVGPNFKNDKLNLMTCER